MTRDDRAEAEQFVWAFSRLYARCRTGSPQDPTTGDTVSHRQAAVLDALCDVHLKYVGDVAARIGVTPSTLSLTLDRMARDGWVERLRDPTDRRKVQVRLTERGARLQKNSEILDVSRVAATLATIDPEQRAVLMAALRNLAQAIDEPDLPDKADATTRRR